MDKNNIAIIISSFSPIIGGSEKQLELISRELIKEGYNIDVITRRYDGLTKKEKIDGININRISVITINKYFEKLSFILNTLIFLLINKKRYNLLIASQFGSCSIISKIYKSITNVPYLVRATGGEARTLSKTEKGKKKFNKVCSNADAFIAINKDIYNVFTELNVDTEKVEYITNGVDLRKRIDVSNNNVVMYCGRIEKVKGVDILLEAWKLIDKEKNIKNTKLVIVGDGSQRKDLMKKYKYLENIEWVGETKNTDEYYKEARFLVAPSRSEGISNTILESMSRGIPVIATNVGGTSEIILAKDEGILVESENVKQIYEAMKLYLKDDDLLEKVSINAYNRIRSNFSIESAKIKYINVFNYIGSRYE